MSSVLSTSNPGSLSLSVGERIAKLRTARGKTLREVADALGVTMTTISYAELGRRRINLNLLQAIAEYFGVPPRILLPGDDDGLERHLMPPVVPDRHQALLLQAYRLRNPKLLLDACGDAIEDWMSRPDEARPSSTVSVLTPEGVDEVLKVMAENPMALQVMLESMGLIAPSEPEPSK